MVVRESVHDFPLAHALPVAAAVMDARVSLAGGTLEAFEAFAPTLFSIAQPVTGTFFYVLITASIVF